MRKIIALAAAAAAAATTALVAAAPASADVSPGCYRPVYTHAVYQFTGTEDADTTLDSLTYPEFVSTCGGRATVLTDDIVDPEDQLPVNEYYRYSFLPDIVGVTFYGPQGPVSTNSVPYDLWLQAGAPQPEVVSTPQDLVYNLASDPASIYLVVGDTSRKLTFDQWNSLGQPAPQTIGSIQRYPFDNSLYFTAFDRAGQPAQTFYLTGAGWASFGNPTPRTTSAIFGDLVFQFQGESAIYLRFPDEYDAVRLTYAQWTSIGQRAPVVYAPTDKAPAKAAAHGTPGAGAAKVIARIGLS